MLADIADGTIGDALHPPDALAELVEADEVREDDEGAGTVLLAEDGESAGEVGEPGGDADVEIRTETEAQVVVERAEESEGGHVSCLREVVFVVWGDGGYQVEEVGGDGRIGFFEVDRWTVEEDAEAGGEDDLEAHEVDYGANATPHDEPLRDVQILGAWISEGVCREKSHKDGVDQDGR